MTREKKWTDLPWQYLVFGLVVAVAGLLSGVAFASPNRGDQCTACHTDTAALPAAHPQISTTSSAQCLSCHGVSSSVQQPQTPDLLTVIQDQAQVQRQHQTHTQDQDQLQTQTQRAIRLSGETEAGLRGQHKGGQGTHAAETTADPLSFRLTLGLLSSSDLSQHRSGSIFHGTEGSAFGQAGADSGGGEHEGEIDEENGSGTRLHLGARASYALDLGDRTSLTFGLRVNRDEFLEEDSGRLNTRLSVEWKRKYENDIAKLTAYLQRTTFDSTSEHTNHDAIGANLIYHKFQSPTATLSTVLRVRQRKYDGETDPRWSDLSLSLGLKDALASGGSYRYGLTMTKIGRAHV